MQSRAGSLRSGRPAHPPEAGRAAAHQAAESETLPSPHEHAAASTGAVAGRSVVAIAASAGGLDALGLVLSALPADFPAAVVVVQHIGPHSPSLLAQILARRTPLPVSQAIDGERFMAG